MKKKLVLALCLAAMAVPASARNWCKRVMPSNVARGHIRKGPPAKNGGPTCWRTRPLASVSGAPISQSSKRSIGSPTKSARPSSSRAASAIGLPRFRATT